jgi:hypothetical protein
MTEKTDLSANESRQDKSWVVLAVFCCVVAAVPLLVVKFPPLTDLPQHVAQVRLFGEALGNSASPYRIQWITPYSLVYTVLGACWLVFGAADAGRLGMIVILIFWVAMLHLLARSCKRPAPAAALATILFFCHILYWGFYQFIFGWPLFIGWVLLIRAKFSHRVVEAGTFFLASLLLYMAHILWFGVALGWLIISHIVFKRNLKTLVLRAASAVPLLALAAAWFPSLAAYGFGSQTIWATTPLERLSPVWLVQAAFGGLRGSLEYVFFGILVGWALLAWLTNRKNFLAGADKELLLLTAFLLFLALVLPDKHTNTIKFSTRWVPPALAFFVIGLPEIRVRKTLLGPVAGAVLVFFLGLTSLDWVAFERSELSGLREALAALPPAPRLIGLSYVKESSIVQGSPFIQVFAYGQVYRGGELNFSFADFGPSLVVYRQRRRIPWTNGLEWFPERAKKTDLLFFNYALINGGKKFHESFAEDPALRPATGAGRWRLYQVSAPPSNPSK